MPSVILVSFLNPWNWLTEWQWIPNPSCSPEKSYTLAIHPSWGSQFSGQNFVICEKIIGKMNEIGLGFGRRSFKSNWAPHKMFGLGFTLKINSQSNSICFFYSEMETPVVIACYAYSTDIKHIWRSNFSSFSFELLKHAVANHNDNSSIVRSHI